MHFFVSISPKKVFWLELNSQTYQKKASIVKNGMQHIISIFAELWFITWELGL